MNIKILDADGKQENQRITTDYYIYSSHLKLMIEFDYQYEFILMSQEKYYWSYSNKINVYIPEVNETHISLLINTNIKSDDLNYKIVIIEENEEGENILNKLNNPCYFFQLFDKDYDLSSEYNNMIIYASSNKDYFIFEEIDISKFNKNKNLYVKILYYSEKNKIVSYSKAKKIYIENIDKINNYKEIENTDNFGTDVIYDNKEYSINNNEYIFKYNIKRNHLGVFPMLFLTYYNTNGLNNVQAELEIINPLLQNITYKLGNASQITLNKEMIFKDYGDYYFIFRNSLGIKFFIHNTINKFPLNESPFYYSNSSDLATDSIMYFSLKLNQKKKVFINTRCTLYFYSKTEKKIIYTLSNEIIDYLPDDYIIINNYENCLSRSHEIIINTELFLIGNEIPLSKEIVSAEFSSLYYYHRFTKRIVVELNSYERRPYIILENYNSHFYKCSQNLNFDNFFSDYSNIDTNFHIINLTNISCPEDEPYIEILFSNTVFELFMDNRFVQENKDFTIEPSNETIVFDIKPLNNTKKYIFIFSNYENLQDLNKTKNDRTRIIFDKSNYYQFKLKPSENIQNKIKIRMYDFRKDIEINTIKENELSDLYISHENNITFKYYINLLKHNAFLSLYDLSGEIEVYLSKDDIYIDDDVIEKIFSSNNISENIFSLEKKNDLIIKPYQIVAIRYNSRIIGHYFYISSLYQDFTINNPIKFIKANNKYLLKKGIIIHLPSKIDVTIKLSTYDYKKNYIINKTCNTFENLDDNLIIESDKDTIIYLYYKRSTASDLKEIAYKRDYPKNLILLLNYKYINFYYEIFYDYTINSNYQSKTNLNKLLTRDRYIKFYYPYNNNNNSLLDVEFYVYSSTESNFYHQKDLNYGYNLLKTGDKYFMSQVIYNNIIKKNLFYQYIKCNGNNDNNEELYIISNNNYKNKLSCTLGSYINYDVNEEIYFIYNLKNDAIFNFYFSEYDQEPYSKNTRPEYKIYFASRNEIIIEILPMFKDKDTEHFIIITIQNEEIDDRLTFLDNICYDKELIDDYKTNYNYNQTNILITSKILSGINSQNVTLNSTEKLEVDKIIYMNIFVEENISEDLNNYLIYNAKVYQIKETDLPEPQKSNDGDEGINGTTLSLIITFSILGGIILILVIFFVYRNINKRRKINDISDLNHENLGEVMLKNE